MDIVIRMLNGTVRSLHVDPQSTLESLKVQIQQTMGVPRYSQRLVLDNGTRTTLDQDTTRLCDYGLQSGSQISLLVIQPSTFQVFLRNEKGQTSTYDVKPDETVTQFKNKVEHKEGVAKDQQRLIHEGKEMVDGRMLSDYNVQALSTIYLTFRLRGG